MAPKLFFISWKKIDFPKIVRYVSLHSMMRQCRDPTKYMLAKPVRFLPSLKERIKTLFLIFCPTCFLFQPHLGMVTHVSLYTPWQL